MTNRKVGLFCFLFFKGDIMKLKLLSHDILLLQDNKTLVNIGTNIRIYDLSSNPPSLAQTLKSLKNPSHVAVSANRELIAYSNTSGHIAVHNFKTGELLWKSKCFNEEGSQLYFIEDDTKLLTVCNVQKDEKYYGRIFTIDLLTQEISIIEDTDKLIFDLYLLPDTNSVLYLAWESEQEELVQRENDLSDSFPDFDIEDSDSVEIFIQSMVDCLAAGNTIEQVQNSPDVLAQIHRLDYGTGMDQIIQLKGFDKFEYQSLIFYQGGVCYMLARDSELKQILVKVNLNSGESEAVLTFHGDFEIVDHVAVWLDKSILLAKVESLSMGDGVAVIDMKGNTMLHFCRIEYVSSIQLIEKESKVLIGTWNKIVMIDYEALLQKDRI